MVEVIARAVVRTGGGIVLARQRGKSWWFLPGGHVEPGEAATRALARELDEELGMAVADEAQVTPIGVVEHAYTEDGCQRSEVNLVFAVTTAQSEFTSREDHLEFAVVQLDDLEGVQVRPGPLEAALRAWLRDGRQFVRTLPALS